MCSSDLRRPKPSCTRLLPMAGMQQSSPFFAGWTQQTRWEGYCLIRGPLSPRLAEISWHFGGCPSFPYGHAFRLHSPVWRQLILRSSALRRVGSPPSRWGFPWPHVNRTPPFTPFVATVGATSRVHSSRATSVSGLSSLFVAMDAAPTSLVGLKARRDRKRVVEGTG